MLVRVKLYPQLAFELCVWKSTTLPNRSARAIFFYALQYSDTKEGGTLIAADRTGLGIGPTLDVTFRLRRPALRLEILERCLPVNWLYIKYRRAFNRVQALYPKHVISYSQKIDDRYTNWIGPIWRAQGEHAKFRRLLISVRVLH